MPYPDVGPPAAQFRITDALMAITCLQGDMPLA